MNGLSAIELLVQLGSLLGASCSNMFSDLLRLLAASLAGKAPALPANRSYA